MPSANRPGSSAAREAALLAAILPNPVRRSAARPGAGVRRLAGIYEGRARPAAAVRVPAPAGLALAGPILYKPAFPDSSGDRRQAPGADFRSDFNGCSEKKTSPSRRGMRRSADALKKPTYVEDKDLGELRRPHHIDLKTGMYRGRQVLKVKTEA